MPVFPRFRARTIWRTMLFGAFAALMTVGSADLSRAADDDSDETFDEKIIRDFMRGLGLRRGDEATIEYRERSPLVVPPSRDLPPPESQSAVEGNPAWPKDQDLARRKEAAKKRRTSTKSDTQILDEESRPLSRTEIDRGRRSGASTTATAPDKSSTDPLSLSELGFKGFTFNSMFGSFGKPETETAPFTGEPTRSTLTQPPVGYQTPSPSYPYGVNLKASKHKPTTLEERTAREQ